MDDATVASTRGHYEDNLYWRRRYSDLVDDYAEACEEIERLKKQVSLLEARVWQLRHRK